MKLRETSKVNFKLTRSTMTDDLVVRLRKRSEIRRQIPSRKSVQNNEPDRIADLLEEAANKIELLLTTHKDV